MGEVGGQISMAIGGTTVDSTTGAFSIQLTHLFAAAPPAMARPWSLEGLGSMTRQPTPHKKE